MFNPLLFLYCVVIPEQLLGSPLVGSEADHFSDEVPHELVVFGQFAFGLAGLGQRRHQKPTETKNHSSSRPLTMAGCWTRWIFKLVSNFIISSDPTKLKDRSVL